VAERFLFCAENLLSDVQYPDHTVTASSAASGFEAYHVATGRRQLADRWSPTTANADHWLKCRSPLLRAANFLAIDRGSNHLGERFVLEASGDDFTHTRTVWDITTPTVPGGSVGEGLGCVTTEGAWLRSFSAEAWPDWRVTSKAMGTGITQQITGLWLGLAWMPTDAVLTVPLDDEAVDVDGVETRSDWGWTGSGRRVRTRSGVIRLQFPAEGEYDQVRYQVLGLYAQGFPAWICWDTDDGAKAMLARCPRGRLPFLWGADWPYRTLDIPFEEEQPL
jgi:hypothetical protein